MYFLEEPWVPGHAAAGPIGSCNWVLFSLFQQWVFPHVSQVLRSCYRFPLLGHRGPWVMATAPCCCVPGESVTAGAWWEPSVVVIWVDWGCSRRINSQTGYGDVILQRFVSKSMCGSRILPRQCETKLHKLWIYGFGLMRLAMRQCRGFPSQLKEIHGSLPLRPHDDVLHLPSGGGDINTWHFLLTHF